jgi:DNA-binding CsgD family transcriptional regulator
MLPENSIYMSTHSSIIDIVTHKRISIQNKTDSQISQREKEVLIMLSNGLSSKQIAGRLFISVNTVNNHRKKILQKLKVSNSAEAITYASSLGTL